MASDTETTQTRIVVDADLGGAPRVPLSLWAATAFAQRLGSRSQAKKAIAAGLLCIAGKVTTSGSCVSGGDTVTLRPPAAADSPLYEDDRFLVKWCGARGSVKLPDADWNCAVPPEGCGLVLMHSTNDSAGVQDHAWEYAQHVVCVVKGAPLGKPGESLRLGLSWGDGDGVQARIVEQVVLQQPVPPARPALEDTCASDGETLGAEVLSTLRLQLRAPCSRSPPKPSSPDSEPALKPSLEALLAALGLTLVRASRSDNMLLACVKIVITRRQPRLGDGGVGDDSETADPEVFAVVERPTPPSFAHSCSAIARACKAASATINETESTQRASHAQQRASKLSSMVQSVPGQSFLEYLRVQQVVPASEQSELEHILQQPLCCCFRINSVIARAQGGANALAELQQRLRESVTTEWSAPLQKSTCVRSAQPIPWYMPVGHAWQMGCDTQVLRRHARSGIAAAIRAHGFLVREAAAGRINRQEAVSMIPPLLLDARPGHRVLDMCAAPGSKSAQLLEAVAAGDHDATEHTPTTTESHAGGGLLVANELDSKRAHVLAHQLARLDATRLVVTCHDASEMPALPGRMGFDRVLCDVPCSGDGTVRKSPLVWGAWHAGKGLSFHELQLRIAKRGCALLAVGGMLVYSTCSFNPIENEAVVAALLQHAGGALELVTTENSLPGLVRRPGLTHWRVGWQRKRQAAVSCSAEYDAADGLQWYDRIDAVPESLKQRLQTTMFAPRDECDSNGTGNAAWTFNRDHLRRCLRIVPQDQNTGAFFVAVLRKVALMPSMSSLSLQGGVRKSVPVQAEHYYRLCDDACRSLCDYWGMSTDVLEHGDLFTRQRSHEGLSSNCPGTVWLLHTDVVRSLGLDTDASVDADNGAALNVLHAGTKLFTPLSGRGLGAARAHDGSESDDTADAKDADSHWRSFARSYRPVHSALTLLAPHMTRRVIDVGYADMRRLLNAATNKGGAELLTDSLGISGQVRALTPGPAVARMRCDDTGAHARALTFWAGAQRVHVMLSSTDAQSLLDVLRGSGGIEGPQSQDEDSDSKVCAVLPAPPPLPAAPCSLSTRTEFTDAVIEPVHAVVPATVSGRRIYHAAGELFDVLGSATAARKLVKQGAITLNGAETSTATCVSEGDRLTLDLARVPLPPVFELKLEVAFVDEHFAVVCKPPGLVTSGNGLRRTLSLALPFNFKRSSERTALLVPRPVHRLDAGTQGLVLVARTSDANVALGAALAGRNVQKRYRAIVAGRLDGQGCVEVDVSGKASKSSYAAVEHTRSLHLPSGWMTTVDLWPHTGRKHQLRVHMASLGHPILGDKLYLDRAGGDKLLKHKGLFLAAVELELDHPVRRTTDGGAERVHVEIAEPRRFAKFREQNARRWDTHHEGAAATTTAMHSSASLSAAVRVHVQEQCANCQ